MLLKGSCHCGHVKFESTGDILRFVYCHCDDCRKINGTAFSAALVVPSSGFRVTAGNGFMTAYESSPGKHRCFCGRCGSPIVSRMEAKPDIVIIRAGTLDDNPDIRANMHIWVKAKAPWEHIGDDLPQHAEGPPSK